MTNNLLARRLVPSPDALASRVGDETVILHLGNDTYFGLDPVGTRIWELAGESLSLAQIRDRIVEEYEADPAQVEEDLLRHGMLMDA